MKIEKIDHDFSICKVSDYTKVDIEDEYCFIGKTDEERSLICMTNRIPDNTIKCDDGWKAFRIKGILDFSLIGILSRISTLLAENKIGIFVLSTYNTDYILTKKENFDAAMKILSEAGYEVI